LTPSESILGNVAGTELCGVWGAANESPYNALWLEIAKQRYNVPTNLSRAVARIDMTVWPAPLIRVFLDQSTPAAVLTAADDPDVRKKSANICGQFLPRRIGAADGRPACSGSRRAVAQKPSSIGMLRMPNSRPHPLE